MDTNFSDHYPRSSRNTSHRSVGSHRSRQQPNLQQSRQSSFASSNPGRSLDAGLNQSLRHLDSRYVDNEENENYNNHYHDSSEEEDDDLESYYGRSLRLGYASSQDVSEGDPTQKTHHHFDSNCVSETSSHDEVVSSATYNFDEVWSRVTRSRDDQEDDDGHNPRSALFRLLNEHCSHVHPSYDEGDSVTYHADSWESAAGNDWNVIREWLREMLPTPSEAADDDDLTRDPDRSGKDRALKQAVLSARGASGQTVLHVACERSVPLDVLELLLAVEHPDHPPLAGCATLDGWLPLHYACNYPNAAAVVRRLVEAWPQAKTAADLKGRTPLHFAMREENMNRPEVVALLAGAAGMADDNGILPLHYACLYGAREDFLRILIEAHPMAMVTEDRFGRVPLHYSLSNAGKPNAPVAVRLLLRSNPDQANLPGIARVFADSDALRKYAVLAKTERVASTYAPTTSRKPRRTQSGVTGTVPSPEAFSTEAVEDCLKRFLEVGPRPTAEFFTALQSLPEPLREKAVLERVVQELLNQKIGQKFPTAVLLLDGYLQILVVVCYTLAMRDSIRARFGSIDIGSTVVDDDFDLAGTTVESMVSSYPQTPEQILCLVGLYLALTYFLVRELVQIIALVSLRASWLWVYEPGNWLNVTYIGFIGAWTILATTGRGDDEIFRNGAACSFAILWIKFLSYLRKILIDFSVFSGGVFHVVRRLLAFLVCLTIILVAFSRMFFALFYETDYCQVTPVSTAATEAEFLAPWDDETFTKNLICEANDTDFPWCNAWDSFLAVYTMLLGEVDETVFGDNSTALFLFVVFMLLVVILLANVLIAIVTDSYQVIRDKRAAIVFWTNRLDFIAQMDAIANGPWKSLLRGFCGLQQKVDDADKETMVPDDAFGKKFWADILELFEHEVLVEDGFFSIDFLLCTILRLAAILVVIPVWILVGALSIGLLWPPQIRERLFVSAITKHSSESEKEETLRKTQIERLKGEIALLKDDLVVESAQHRTQIVQMKSAVVEQKLETMNILTEIKQKMQTCLELTEM